MSTRFGIYRGQDDIELIDDSLPKNYEKEDFIEVAHRSNNGGFSWLNKLADKLPLHTKVYPLDNSAQGIYTIQDIQKNINKSRYEF